MRKNRTLLITVLLLIVAVAGTVDAKVTVNSVTVSTDKPAYSIGEEAIATAVLDFTGNKNQLQGVNFTWYYPNGTVAKFDPDVAPDGSGTAYSSWATDFTGSGFLVNATYTGDTTKYDTTTFDVNPASPGNQVGGHISSDTTWYYVNSPYIVIDNVTVDPGVTLTVEAGVVVEFNNLTKLDVQGTLITEGTSTNYTTFTSNNTAPAPGDWMGIYFNGSGSTDSILTFSRVEYTYYGIYIDDSSPTIIKNIIRDVFRDGIYGYNTSAYIAYNTITAISYDFASNTGIRIGPYSNPLVYQNVITDVEEYGIKLSYSTATIDGNLISNCYYPIYVMKTNTTIGPTIINNTLWNGIDGLYLYEVLNITISNNTIMNNSGNGINSYLSSPWIIDDNFIYDNNKNGILLYKHENATVINNPIYSNEWGIRIRKHNNSFIFGNNISDNIKIGHGVWSDDSFNLTFLNNTISGNQNGFFIEDSINVTFYNNTISSNTWKGIWLTNTTNSTIGFNNITGNNRGIYLDYSGMAVISNDTLLDNNYGMYSSSTPFIMYNGTIESLTNDFHLLVGSIGTSVNTSFDSNKVEISSDSVLTVKNYLHVKVEYKNNTGIENASINVTDNDEIVYSNKTDVNGSCNWILLTDRIYDGSSTATENTTSVNVTFEEEVFPQNPRDVDMSTSHLEEFVITEYPLVDITSHENEAVVNKTVVFEGTASDVDGYVVLVEIMIETEPWLPVNDISAGGNWSNWNFTWDTYMLANGTYNISVRAIDDDGAETINKINVTVLNEVSGPDNGGDDGGDDGGGEVDEGELNYTFLFLIILIAIILALIMYFVERKKGKDEDEKERVEESEDEGEEKDVMEEEEEKFEGEESGDEITDEKELTDEQLTEGMEDLESKEDIQEPPLEPPEDESTSPHSD